MAVTRTERLKLRKPSLYDVGWDVPINANAETLDDLNVIGGFAVQPANFDANEDPSGLQYDVAGGVYVSTAGVRTTVASFAEQAATASATTYVWLTKTGALGTSTSGYPTAGTVHAPLARVVAGASNITSITDDRFPMPLIGGFPFGQLYVNPTLVTDEDGPTYQMVEGDHYLDVHSEVGGGATLTISPYEPGTRGNLIIVNHVTGDGPVKVQHKEGSDDQGWTTLHNPGESVWLVAFGDEYWRPLVSVAPENHSPVTITTDTTLTRLSAGTIRCDCSAGPITVTLPALSNASGAQRVYTIKKVDSSGNAVTIDGAAAETIDGQATRTLTAQYQTIRIGAVEALDVWDVL